MVALHVSTLFPKSRKLDSVSASWRSRHLSLPAYEIETIITADHASGILLLHRGGFAPPPNCVDDA